MVFLQAMSNMTQQSIISIKNSKDYLQKAVEWRGEGDGIFRTDPSYQK